MRVSGARMCGTRPPHVGRSDRAGSGQESTTYSGAGPAWEPEGGSGRVAREPTHFVNLYSRAWCGVGGEVFLFPPPTHQGFATGSPRTYTAAAAIVTLQQGVLKAGDVAFDPPLPPWKTLPIGQVGSGLLNNVSLCFAAPFWPPTDENVAHAPAAAADPTIRWRRRRVRGGCGGGGGGGGACGGRAFAPPPLRSRLFHNTLPREHSPGGGGGGGGGGGIGGRGKAAADAFTNGFRAVQLVGGDFLPSVSLRSLRLWTRVLAAYAARRTDVNAALTAVGLLWRTADALAHPVAVQRTPVRRRETSGGVGACGVDIQAAHAGGGVGGGRTSAGAAVPLSAGREGGVDGAAAIAVAAAVDPADGDPATAVDGQLDADSEADLDDDGDDEDAKEEFDSHARQATAISELWQQLFAKLRQTATEGHP